MSRVSVRKLLVFLPVLFPFYPRAWPTHRIMSPAPRGEHNRAMDGENQERIAIRVGRIEPWAVESGMRIQVTGMLYDWESLGPTVLARGA